MTDGVVYAEEPGLDVDEFQGVLHRSGLAARRPVRDTHRLQRMIEAADIVLCARDRDGHLIGMARALTDFSYCCYLSDLAVEAAWQGKGIGQELIKRSHQIAGLETKLVVLSAPDALTYYAHIGLDKADNAFVIDGKA